jgi:hypothetical protein
MRKQTASSNWAKKYKDSRWQKLRLEIMERDNWTCQSCFKSGEGVTLNVHHAYYESGKAPWEYDESVLITWCEECHTTFSKLKNILLKKLIVENGVELMQELCGYADAFFGPSSCTNKNYSIGFARGRIIFASESDAIAVTKNNLSGLPESEVIR